MTSGFSGRTETALLSAAQEAEGRPPRRLRTGAVWEGTYLRLVLACVESSSKALVLPVAAASANVSEKVSFLVEKTDKGVRVMVKGQPKTKKESINKAAYGYTGKHLGPKGEIGNKGGNLSNRLRAALAQ